MGDNAVTSMAFAPDGKQLAVGTQWREFGAILVVPITGDTAQRGEELMPDRVEGFPNPIDAVGYTFDGVMVGASTQLIRIQRDEAIRQFERRGSGPVLVDRDSRFIVELDGADVTIRDLDETVLERIPRIGSASSVVSLGRGAGLAFAFRDRVEAWRPIAPVSRIKESCRDLQIYEDRVVTVQNAFSSAPQIVGAEILSGRSWRLDVVSGDPPGDVLLSRGDRDLLVSRSLRGNLDIWRILAPQKIHISALKRIETAAFSPTGNLVAVADKMRVAIVDVDSGAVRNLDNRQGVTKLSISDDGNRLAIGHRGGALEVLEIGTGKRIARDPTRSAVAHGGDTIDLKWLPGGEALLVEEFSMDGMEPRLLRMLWDLRSNKIVWESIDVEREGRTGATLDPRGDFFVSLVGENQCLTIVHIDGRATCIYAAENEQVTAVAISPVESIVAYGRSDGIVELYDVSIGGGARVIDSDGAAITALKFADGNVLAIGRQDGTVSVIGYNSGSRVLRASGPGPVQHLQFDAGAEMLGAIYVTGEECQIRKLPVKGADLPLYSEPDVLLGDSHSRTGLTLDNDVLINTDSAGR